MSNACTALTRWLEAPYGGHAQLLGRGPGTNRWPSRGLSLVKPVEMAPECMVDIKLQSGCKRDARHANALRAFLKTSRVAPVELNPFKRGGNG